MTTSNKLSSSLTGKASVLTLLLMVAVPCAVCGEAQAQSSGRAENPEADKFVAEGIELRARGKDTEALRAFQKAAEIDPPVPPADRTETRTDI